MIPYLFLDYDGTMEMIMRAGPALVVLLAGIVIYAVYVNYKGGDKG